MEFLVRMGPKETKAIILTTKMQFERLLIKLCDNMPNFAMESSLGFILKISDELLVELYESLPDDVVSKIPSSNKSRVVAAFIRGFCRNRGMDRYTEIRFVSLLPPEEDAEEKFSNFLYSSD